MKNTLFNISMVFLLACGAGKACTDDLLSDIREPDALIVVDGWIEYGDQAKVFLTTNAPYFTSIDSASIRDLVLSRAKVSLSDGVNSEVLILRKDSRYFPPFYYAGNSIFGDTGKIYTLTAEYGGKSVSAQTSIPHMVAIDTAYFRVEDGLDSLGYIELLFTDPPEQKNYYRIYTKRVGKDERFVSSFLMAIDDQYFSGEQLKVTLRRAPESFLSSSENEYFELGDSVLVKLSTMDQQTFDFWNSYQEEVINSTNPFASAMTGLESNISGDGLGVWGGYGFSIATVVSQVK